MPPITITITLNEKRELSVNGPLNDMILCFGMLESAKCEIRELHEKMSQSPIVAPTNQQTLALARG